MTNRLASASSAYLRQHAENPVDWRTWGHEALEEAVRLDRPIFLSVGYAACHWCHVMAHESFEDPDVAALLNEFFIPVKVDREERPDVDALYMAATQLLSGHGGWPMSVFLTPDARAFMAGTYYPPVDRHGQVGFTRLLNAMHDAWVNQRGAVEQQAAELQEGIGREVSFIDHLAPYAESLDLSVTRQRLRNELVERVDVDGGFGDAPKFPRPSYAEALIDFDDPESRTVLERTLDAMSRRGLYDHLRGGFARYSVDGTWHVPHFEKMLSDQALLARTYLRAAAVIPEHDEWRDVAFDTIKFVLTDLSLPRGFASSLDADAGGVEGSHVTWTPDEVREALESDGRNDDVLGALTRWRITDPGEFEGRSIPRLANGAMFMTPLSLEEARNALRRTRAARPQPLRDEKVILEWNAMFASALLRSGHPEFKEDGVALLRSLTRTHFANDSWWRTEDQKAYASAGDVAWLLDASLDAFELRGDDEWIVSATALANYLLAHYWDGDVPSSTRPDVGGGVFAQSDLVTDLGLRTKEIFDGATPS
ncbi:MAG: thioredoxin domain-containing protein, partial [Acidimicrobiales bacterium]